MLQEQDPAGEAAAADSARGSRREGKRPVSPLRASASARASLRLNWGRRQRAEEAGGLSAVGLGPRGPGAAVVCPLLALRVRPSRMVLSPRKPVSACLYSSPRRNYSGCILQLARALAGVLTSCGLFQTPSKCLALPLPGSANVEQQQEQGSQVRFYFWFRHLVTGSQGGKLM